MNPNRKHIDTPYTKDELEKTVATVNQHIKDAVYSVILAYLHEFHPEYTHDNGAESIVETVLPVVLCMVEDGMRTGEYIAERRIAQMLVDVKAIKMQPVSASNIQN